MRDMFSFVDPLEIIINIYQVVIEKREQSKEQETVNSNFTD